MDAVAREHAGKAPFHGVSRLREAGLSTLLAPAGLVSLAPLGRCQAASPLVESATAASVPPCTRPGRGGGPLTAVDTRHQ